MRPTILEGERIAVNKMAYGYSAYSCPFAICPISGRLFGSEPERGDVVVFRHPVNGQDFIKRVVGMPGDTVQMRDGLLYINGEVAPQVADGRFVERYEPQGPQQRRPPCLERSVPLGGDCSKEKAIETLVEQINETFPGVPNARWVALRMLDKIDGIALALMLGIGGAMFLLLGLRTDTEVADTAAEIVTEPWWIFFLAGAIAICAMILPGISGSFILVMLGMYTEVLGAVNDRDFTVLIAFMIGCVVGLALFSTLLNWLLERKALMAITPKPVQESRLVMSASDLTRLFLAVVLGLPAAVALLGGLVWARRRQCLTRFVMVVWGILGMIVLALAFVLRAALVRSLFISMLVWGVSGLVSLAAALLMRRERG